MILRFFKYNKKWFKRKIIAVDFDGTLVKDMFPEIGKWNKKLVKWLLKAQNNGAKLILWTCRNYTMLEDAVEDCKDHGLYFDAVNKNLPHIIDKYYGDTRKVFADIYIDDKGVRFNA